jgi:hypothetical protein
MVPSSLNPAPILSSGICRAPPEASVQLGGLHCGSSICGTEGAWEKNGKKSHRKKMKKMKKDGKKSDQEKNWPMSLAEGKRVFFWAGLALPQVDAIYCNKLE